MTPPAASTITGHAKGAAVRARRPATASRRATAMPRGARRVSGPAGGLPAMRLPTGTPAFAGAGAGAGAAYTPLGVRLARRAAGVQDARLLDRLIRGRLWIALIGVMLIGLVFLQLSLLSLNAGIGDALQRSSVLERANASLRTQVSKLDAGQRVQDVAAGRGMVMPPAGDVHYLKAGAVPASVAARGIAAPSQAARAQAAAGAGAGTLSTPTAAPAAPAAGIAAPAASTPGPVTTPAATAPVPPVAVPDVAPSGTAPPAAAATAAVATPQG